MAETKILINASNGRKIPAWVMHPDGADVKLEVDAKGVLQSSDNILILALHGVGENGKEKDSMNWLDHLRNGGSQMLYRSVQQQYKGRNFILLAPQLYQGDQADWNENRNACWPAWYITECINYAYKNLKFDPQRFCGTGLSLGGGGLLNFITQKAEYPKFFSACVFACPVGIDGGYQHIANAKLPTVFYHCQDDWVGFKYSWNAMMGINATPGVTIKSKGKYPGFGGHNIWDIVYDPKGDPWGNGVNMYDYFILNKFLDPREMPEIDKPSGVIIPDKNATTTIQVTTKPVTTAPGATTIPVLTSRPAATTQPAATTVGKMVLNLPKEIRLPAGTSTYIFDGSKSQNWHHVFFEMISGPSKVWFTFPGNANGAQDFKNPMWQVYNLKDGLYKIKGSVESKGGEVLSDVIYLYVGEPVATTTVPGRKLVGYMVSKLYNDNTVDPPVRVEIEKVNMTGIAG